MSTRPKNDPRAELPDDVEFVPRHQAQDYGYWGARPDTTDPQRYTVLGTENEDDKFEGGGVDAPSSAASAISAVTSSSSKTSSKKEGADK